MAKIEFLEAMKTIVLAIPLVTAALSGVVLSAILIGILVGVATGGSIDIPSAFTTLLGNLSDTAVTVLISVGSVIAVAVTLLIVVVIYKLFKNQLMGKSGKGDKM